MLSTDNGQINVEQYDTHSKNIFSSSVPLKQV